MLVIISIFIGVIVRPMLYLCYLKPSFYCKRVNDRDKKSFCVGVL